MMNNAAKNFNILTTRTFYIIVLILIQHKIIFKVCI